MGIGLDPKQVVSFEELLMSQVVQQEALTRLLVEKGIFSKEEFWEMVRVVNQEMKRKK
jgi:site-specific recombinase